MIKRGKDWKLSGTREKRPGDTRYQADDNWRACASRCHGLEGVLRARGASEAHARGLARARASRVRASPATERAPGVRGGWYQGVGEVRFQVTWG